MSTQVNPVAESNALPALERPLPLLGQVRENLAELRARWGWFVALGVCLMFVGLVAMSYSVLATFATALVFGYFLLAGGFFYIVGAFFTRCWKGFFLSLLGGVLHLAVGFLVLDRPGEVLLVYTLLMAAFFFVEGLFRIFGALVGRFEHWGWMLFNGFVTLALGVLIWRQWPVSALYVIGLFLGIDLVISGASYIGLGLSARKLPVG